MVIYASSKPFFHSQTNCIVVNNSLSRTLPNPPLPRNPPLKNNLPNTLPNPRNPLPPLPLPRPHSLPPLPHTRSPHHPPRHSPPSKTQRTTPSPTRSLCEIQSRSGIRVSAWRGGSGIEGCGVGGGDEGEGSFRDGEGVY